MRRLSLIVFLFLLLLTGCDQQSFTPIPKRMETLISINIKDGSATFFDLEREKKYAQWNLQKPIRGGALLNNGQTLLLYGNDLDQAYEYDLATGKLKKEWQVGEGIVGALVSNDMHHIFLADQKQKEIRIFRTDGKEIGAVKVGSAPLTLLQNSDGTRLYVIDFHDAKTDIIDVPKRKVIHMFFVPKSSLGGLLREQQQEIWIGGHGSGSAMETSIHVYSLPDGKLAKTVPAPDMPIGFTETNEGIFALSHGSNMVRKWNNRGKEEAALVVGANPFTIVGTNRHLYVASYDSDEIDVIDGRTMRVVHRYKAGKGPFQLMIRGGDKHGANYNSCCR
ncbi:YncE family protein [Anoxybacteroides tepidamans]|uniref:YncE family protein n=1 Tax=Anoxybacteroides tepidamans TaxID=265948 RepID=UPI00048205DF|nr:hypothetical protein [Anoxybacillus tepidamans]